MTDRPITFSGPMVRALLEGRKTQTRRILKPSSTSVGFPGTMWPSYVDGERVGESSGYPHIIRLPTDAGGEIFGGPTPVCPGDRLYVREAWRSSPAYDDLAPSKMGGYEAIRYLADGHIESRGWIVPDSLRGRRRASFHMPKWASRLTLHVSDVRVQKLQEISNEDAVAEGCSGFYSPCHPDQGETDGQMPWEEFRDLWNSLHGSDAWDRNDWVAAYSFEVEHCSISEARAA